MKYRTYQKNDDQLSILGMGCMRFDRRNGAIDQKKADAVMKRALDLGVNYFDTAYVYPGSEECLGRFVEKYNCRDKIKIATKLPHYRIKKSEDIEKYFSQELKRLKTDYVDYYMMHMLNDMASWQRLKSLGIEQWIQRKIKQGAIRRIGFSFHGGTESFKKLVDAYDWDFCQIQFNYLDEHSQAGIEGLKYASKKGLGVIIMEPLRGGTLARIPARAKYEFDRVDSSKTPAEWGLRWIWNHPEVTVVLSGMNDIAQVEENCRVSSEMDPDSLTDRELKAYYKVVSVIQSSRRVGCTGCGYCQPCPQNVDIPNCFSAYNNSYSVGYFTGFREYIMCTVLRNNQTFASKCVQCGACEKKCPQHIKIRRQLKNVRHRFETPVFSVVKKVAAAIMKY